MACALELKRMLTNIQKADTQTMDAYLHYIKTIADNLTSVNSPVSQTNLVHYTLMGLGCDYEKLVTTLTHLALQLTFSDLCPRLLLHEQCLWFLDGDEMCVTHPALAAQSTKYSHHARSKNALIATTIINEGVGATIIAIVKTVVVEVTIRIITIAILSSHLQLSHGM